MSKVKQYIFSDIDDTLIYSVRELKTIRPDQSVGALKKDKSINSYFTNKSNSLLNLFSDATIIPVTGRTSEGLSNVMLAFNDYKIIAHGMIILDKDNRIVKEFNPEIINHDSLLESYLITLNKRYEEIRHSLRIKVVEDFGYKCYLSVKADAVILQKIAKEIKNLFSDVYIHLNNRNLAIIPSSNMKEKAVAFLLDILNERYSQNILSIGLGDSHSDIPFMHLCDYVLYPQKSQIKGILDECIF